MSLQLAILAGGMATRLGSISREVPKALVDVAGRPFAEHQVELAKAAGLTRLVFCVGHLGEQVVAALGNGRRWGVDIAYVFDGPRLLGTGGALRRALPALDDAFFVLYGDSYVECDFIEIEEAFFAGGTCGLLTVYRNKNRWVHSNVLLSGGRIMQYDKVSPTPAMQHIDHGLSVLRRAALEPYAPDRELDLGVVYQNLVANGQLAALEVAERFYEIGSPAGLEEARRHLAAKRGGSP